MLRMLVTGGAGYIGSILVPALLAEGHRVTVLDNFMYQQNSLLDCCSNEGLRVIRGDCRDEKTVRFAIKDQDVIIALAAVVGAPLCKEDQTAARSTNLDAIKLLLSLRSRDQRIIYPNTNSGYGVGENGKHCTEDSPLRPLTLYGQTKVEAEKAVLDAGNAIAFRLATVFGTAPRMRIDLLVNEFVYRAVTDRAIVVFEGHFKRNYVHVRDVARAFLHGIANFETMKDQPYNLGLDDANLSKLELCEKIKEYVPGFVFLEAPIGEDPDKRDYIVSNQRLLSTGFQPHHSLDMGIRELIKGYMILRNSRYSNV
ncbi:MAG: NAD(P)-dependent oxidoreductase [Dehalococcoidales bacterium]|nr:NAD(P)-dependent oxidoreductase [Dehalococcoidales bacterium]